MLESILDTDCIKALMYYMGKSFGTRWISANLSNISGLVDLERLMNEFLRRFCLNEALWFKIMLADDSMRSLKALLRGLKCPYFEGGFNAQVTNFIRGFLLAVFLEVRAKYLPDHIKCVLLELEGSFFIEKMGEAGA
ncbi:MAG: hypothetical protein NZ920_02100 [Aigarchaeota archaeon]|nr:hypothetical protein [Aigarchaeota archaeon]MDW8092582.1 hypothetical protein [Nitrososphaerota archaeon]